MASAFVKLYGPTMEQAAAWRVSINAHGPEGFDGEVVAMLLFCSDVGGTISRYTVGQSSLCVEIDVKGWTEQAARARVLTKMAAVLGKEWTLEITDGC
jgi:hypothetical protein